jgi:ubiquinone/menaquinone biosynthesis C-methylase UbiE
LKKVEVVAMNVFSQQQEEYIGGSNANEIGRLDTLSKTVEQLTHHALKLAGIGVCHSILDLGCGPGNVSIPLAHALQDAFVHGVDCSASFIEEARSRAEQQHVSNISFHIADAQLLPFQKETFDFVIVRFLLQHVKQVDAVLKEIKRVCKPGAKIVVIETDWGGQIFHPEPAHAALMNHRLPKLLLEWGTDVHIGRKVPSYIMNSGLHVNTVYSDMQVFHGETLTAFTDAMKSRLQIMEETIAKRTASDRDAMKDIREQFASVLKTPYTLGTNCRIITIAQKQI